MPSTHAICLLWGFLGRWIQFLAQNICPRSRWPSRPAEGLALEVKSNRKRSKSNFSHISYKFPCNMSFMGVLGRWIQLLAQNIWPRSRWPSRPAGGLDLEVKSNRKRSKSNFFRISHKLPCNMSFMGFFGPLNPILSSKYKSEVALTVCTSQRPRFGDQIQ